MSDGVAPPLPEIETAAPGVARPSHLLWAVAFGAVALALVVAGGFLVDHWPFNFDRSIMLALRDQGDLATPRGPHWLLKAMSDITALGGGTVLTLAVAGCAGLLLVRRLWLTALLVVAATVTGSLVVQLAKHGFARARPEIVGHLVQASGMGFPSGHSANSAICYLTLALLMSQVAHGRATRRYILVLAVLLVGAIGFSRVYLGVHWPSDVMAGWSFGTFWALGWWSFGAWLRGRVARTRE